MILVTGVSGLLGLTLADRFLRQGHAVAGISRIHRVALPGLRWIEADLRDTGAITALVDELRPAAIVHAAAWTDVDACEADPEQALAVNAAPCRALAEAANRADATLLYISTDSVFDGRAGSYGEEAAPAPLNAYARSKLRGEEIVLETAARPLIARVNIYGWNGQDKRSLAEWVLRELSGDREITGFTDVVFSPLLTDDLADILLAMLHARLHGLYHAGAGDACSKFAFARQAAELFGLPADRIRPGRLRDRPLKAPRPLDTSLDSSRVEAALRRRLPTVREGLARFHALSLQGRPAELKQYLPA